MRCYVYMRKSTAEQKFTNQNTAIERWIRQQNLYLTESFEETCSGVTKIRKREKLPQVLSRLRRNDLLIVSDLSRLSRNVFLMFKIVSIVIDRRAKIYSVYDQLLIHNDMTNFFALVSIISACQRERDIMVARAVEKKNYKKNVLDEGKPKKHNYPAQRKSPERKLDAVIADVIDLALDGWSVKDIARHFGVSRDTVDRALVRAGYARRFYCGIYKKLANSPRIFPPEFYDKDEL